MAVDLRMSDDGRDGEAAQLARDDTEDAMCLAGDDDAARIFCVVAKVTLVDAGSLDRTACCGGLGALNDVPQGVTVIGIVWLAARTGYQAPGGCLVAMKVFTRTRKAWSAFFLRCTPPSGCGMKKTTSRAGAAAASRSAWPKR